MAQSYRKQFGLGLDGKPRRYGPKPKNTNEPTRVKYPKGKCMCNGGRGWCDRCYGT
jgi:hypothetical protein